MIGMNRRKGWIEIDEEACNGCAQCLVVCPVGAFEPSGRINGSGHPTVRFTGEDCRADARCVRACPRTGALTLRAA